MSAVATWRGGQVPTLKVGTNAVIYRVFNLPGPNVVVVGLATETDSALTAIKHRVKTAGLATESDSALAATRRRTKAVGLTSETDQALSLIGLTHFVSVGIASTANIALPVTRVRTYHIGIATEIDTALDATPIIPGVKVLHRMALEIHKVRSTITSVSTP